VHLGPDDSPDEIKRKIEGARDAGATAADAAAK
jgi:hypothetical protein